MTPPVVLPDAAAAVQERLLAVLDASVSVVTELDSDDSRRPIVVVSTTGGAPVFEGVLDAPRVDLDVRSDDRAAGLALAKLAQAYLVTTSWGPGWSAPNAGAIVTACSTVANPVHLKDPNTGEHRHILTVQPIMHPA